MFKKWMRIFDKYLVKRISRFERPKNKEMKVKLVRFHNDDETTVGNLFIDDKWVGFIVEDQPQTKKIFGETRIPSGVYKLGLRSDGGFHSRYLKKFGFPFHKGMICIYNRDEWKIENRGMTFQYVLIHIGNDDDDTAGCLLTNFSFHGQQMTGANSANMYQSVYPIIRDAILEGDEVTIEVIDN